MAAATRPLLSCGRISEPRRWGTPEQVAAMLRSLRRERIRLLDGRMTWCVEAYIHHDGGLNCICLAEGYEPENPRAPPPKPAPFVGLSAAALFDVLTKKGPRRRTRPTQ